MIQTNDQIRGNVREALVRVLPNPDIDISDDDDIFALGLDSVTTLLLITELENRHSIILAADEIPYDQLRTINGIASFITAKLESG